MPISVTCQCGARLEIDEKFLGKEVPCPDCQRPLPMKAANVAPPPLELPDYRRTSGLAVLSLALALVGAFTIVGTIAAIVVGVFALKEIAAKSSKLEGIGYARAGIIVGAIMTFVTLTAFVSPYIFGIDAMLRELALASRVQYPSGEIIKLDITNGDVEIQRPKPIESWGQLISGNQQTANVESDLLILVNIRDDAYISCQHDPNFLDDGDEAIEKGALERFRKSELVNLIDKSKGKPPEERIVAKKPKTADGTYEIILDIRLGGRERRCILLYRRLPAGVLVVMVGCARSGRFESMQEDFRKANATLKVRI